MPAAEGTPRTCSSLRGCGDPPLIRLEAEAKRICSDCPVVSQCRDHAVRTPELWGVWGAMTSRERAKLYPSSTTR